jgi:ATP-binding cassette subfamily F protein uup
VAAAPRPKKLSYKDQRDFDSLPARIEALEAEKAALEAQAGDPAFYAGPQDAVRTALARLESIGGEIDAAYERWAALESLRAG